MLPGREGLSPSPHPSQAKRCSPTLCRYLVVFWISAMYKFSCEQTVSKLQLCSLAPVQHPSRTTLPKAMYQVYLVKNTATHRVYVGFSKHAHLRYRQHAYTPPRRMAAHVQQSRPFQQYFEFSILHESTDLVSAKAQETHLIQQHNATGPMGYNTLPSQPSNSRNFWAIYRRRK